MMALVYMMARLFTEYDVARNSQVLRWHFCNPHAMSYSINNQATVPVTLFGLVIGGGPRLILRFPHSVDSEIHLIWSDSLLCTV